MCQFFCENPFIWGMGCFGVGGGGGYSEFFVPFVSTPARWVFLWKLICLGKEVALFLVGEVVRN